jgi:peptide/nickel transport system permease protein
VQYWDYMKRLVLHFDFGYSYQNLASVRSQIFDRLPATISLTLGAAVLWIVGGVAVGTISAVKRGRLVDRVAMTGALIGISAPVYWLGLVGLYFFANDIGKLHVFPGAGSYTPLTDNPINWFTSLLLPWIGLSEPRVIVVHGVRSAITPVVTAAGLDIGILLGGAILTETVFNIPGVGRLAYESIQNSDLPMIQGTVLLGAFFIILLNLVVDVLYAFIDPRVRYA